jgi:hypothetical protein
VVMVRMLKQRQPREIKKREDDMTKNSEHILLLSYEKRERVVLRLEAATRRPHTPLACTSPPGRQLSHIDCLTH